MTKHDLKKLIENLKEDYYPDDRKDNFNVLKIIYKEEDEDEYPTTLVSSENIYVCRWEKEIYWIKMQRKEFEEMIKHIKDEDIDFAYEEGNNGYADEYSAELVSVTPNYVYFTLEGMESDD